MWSDNETSIDLLGFQVHSNLIKAIVTDAKLLPVTVGIFGDWGSGKSSIMKMLQENLKENDKVACIYFNGWQFEGYEDAKAALVYSILLELSTHQRIIPGAKEKAKSLLKRVDWLKLANVGYQAIIAPILAGYLAAQIGVAVSPVQPQLTTPQLLPPTLSVDEDDLKGGLSTADWKDILKADDKNIMGIRQFREDFKGLIAETKLSAIVIVVDDLDRCTPDRLVETLEAIKLFLAVPNVAFVIGADERIVRYAIAKRYEMRTIAQENQYGEQAIDLVTDYLEKLIQIPYFLPRLSPSEIETYMSLLFCEHYLTEEIFDKVYRAFQESRQRDITSTYGYQEVKQVFELNGILCSNELDDYLGWCSIVAPTFSNILKGNPRQTKRLLNTLLLRRKLVKAAHLDFLSEQVLVKLMLLKYFRPHLFAQLYQWQTTQNGCPHELDLLEAYVQDEAEKSVAQAEEFIKKNEGWTELSIKQWLQMPPFLSGVDLRNYFWVTRDQVTGITAGVTTIPRYLRQIILELIEMDSNSILPQEIQSQLQALSTGDLFILLDELAQRFKREEDKHNIIETWASLIEIIPDARHRFLTLLEETPATTLQTDAIAATKVELLYHSHEDIKAQAIDLLGKWSREHTVLGRAAKEIFANLEKGIE